ncbi:methyltransferase domain-containing protein [bacterium]|nr:methyltransferase domain-containing protein [bacterium]
MKTIENTFALLSKAIYGVSTKMTTDEFKVRTRNVFHEIHKGQIENSTQMKRKAAEVDFLKIGFSDNFFNDKVYLEAGCGSLAPMGQSLLKLGAKKVYCIDLDESIFEIAPKLLAPYQGRYELQVGDVLDLPFDDDMFDFVGCAGVLHSTGNTFEGVKQLARVTKPGGAIYLSMLGQGGLMEEFMNSVRNRYINDPEFRNLIDNLDSKKLLDGFCWLKEKMESNDDKSGDLVSESLFAELFDQDLVLTIKDRIQAPVYDYTRYDDLIELLASLGFTNFQRVRGEYFEFPNIRRYLAPLYSDFEHPFSQILGGDGMLKVIAVKKAE